MCALLVNACKPAYSIKKGEHMKKMLLVLGALMVTGLCANASDVYIQGGIPHWPPRNSSAKPSVQTEVAGASVVTPATGQLE